MKTLLTPTSIGLLAYINDQLITERRRGLDGTVTLPPLREVAKSLVHEQGLLTLESSTPIPAFGEYAP